jgi:transposase InsO family protein
MGLLVLKTPVRTPQANAPCERLIGTIRRECLDWLIPLSERVRRPHDSLRTAWSSHVVSACSSAGIQVAMAGGMLVRTTEQEHSIKRERAGIGCGQSCEAKSEVSGLDRF